MAMFLIRRIGHGILVLWLISVAVFALFFVAPSNVAQTLAGRQGTPETIALIKHRLGLDLPVWQQYLHFLGNAVKGNLGYDYYHQVPVTHIIGQALPITVSLALGAAVLWLALGVFNGVISATHPRSLADRGLTLFALFFYSFPSFLLGLLLLYFLYFRLTLSGFGWFPAGGYAPLAGGIGPWFQHLLLPWVALALLLAATYTRLTRGSMLDVLGEDYIRTARSKGIRESRVVVVHGLRSALTPVVTQFGIDLGQLIGGVVVTETVFSLPGARTDRGHRDQPAGPTSDHRHRPVRLGGRRGGEHPRRHRVRRTRSTRPTALAVPEDGGMWPVLRYVVPRDRCLWRGWDRVLRGWPTGRDRYAGDVRRPAANGRRARGARPAPD
jgi:peptide/nickel transport system permease protein